MQKSTVQPIRSIKQIDSIKKILWAQSLRDWLLFTLNKFWAEGFRFT